MEERTLYVGMDVRENKIQLCVYPPKGGEIQTILEDFPLAIAIREDKKDWLYEQAALQCKAEKDSVFITDFPELLRKKEKVVIFGVSFSPEELLSKILKKALILMKKEYPDDLIKKLVVSLETMDALVIEGFEKAFLRLGIEKDRLRMESHGQSFLCYALSRKRELWLNEIGLFDCDKTTCIFRKICLDRRKKPMIAGVSKEIISFSEETLSEALETEISTLYFTGSGFCREEQVALVQRLCRGRICFLVDNLYCNGACISARREYEPECMENFLFLEEDSVKCEVTLPVYHDAKECMAVLIGADELWYQTGQSVCLILDEEEEIPLHINHVLTGEEKVYIISLDGLIKRPERMTKILVKVRFLEQNCLVVTVKDLGFGEFFPSSERIWEKTISI